MLYSPASLAEIHNLFILPSEILGHSNSAGTKPCGFDIHFGGTKELDLLLAQVDELNLVKARAAAILHRIMNQNLR